MPKRLTLLQVSDQLLLYECKMIGTTYINRRGKLDLQCNRCGETFSASLASLEKGCGCKCGYISQGGRPKIYPVQEKKCEWCNNCFTVNGKTRLQKYCSRKCVTSKLNSGLYRDANSKGGKISATRRNKRSLNEIYFADLCKAHFGEKNILTNEPMFNGWDADVIITSEKIAVMWNGAWHYKQIQKGHSVLQTQNRDRLKERVIHKAGYRCYTIKDMGKHNKKFVEHCFQVFLFMIIQVYDT